MHQMATKAWNMVFMTLDFAGAQGFGALEVKQNASFHKIPSI